MVLFQPGGCTLQHRGACAAWLVRVGLRICCSCFYLGFPIYLVAFFKMRCLGNAASLVSRSQGHLIGCCCTSCFHFRISLRLGRVEIKLSIQVVRDLLGTRPTYMGNERWTCPPAVGRGLPPSRSYGPTGDQSPWALARRCGGWIPQRRGIFRGIRVRHEQPFENLTRCLPASKDPFAAPCRVAIALAADSSDRTSEQHFGLFVSSLLLCGFLLPPSKAGGSTVSNCWIFLCIKRSLQVGCVKLARTFMLTVNFCLLAQGHGAKGDNIYEFQIEFLEPVEPKVGIVTFLTLAKRK